LSSEYDSGQDVMLKVGFRMSNQKLCRGERDANHFMFNRQPKNSGDI
jgi:hypothetical protein